MKTIRPILNALAALAALAVLGACAQTVAPQSQPGGTTGRVILTVSAGPENSARTILPEEEPEFSKYEVDFSGGTPVSTVDISDIPETGVIQELPTGIWTVTVKAYRHFTPPGDMEGDYLVAQGSSDPINVTGGAPTPITVLLKPVISGSSVKGIFTYTVNYPNTVLYYDATLTLSGQGTYNLTSGQKNSIAVDPGEYDLTISLKNSAGFTAGASEKVHIYASLESAVTFSFTATDFASTIRLEGTVSLPGGVSVRAGTIGVYRDSSYTNWIKTEPILAGNAWATTIQPNYVGSTLYFKQDVIDSDGNVYTVKGNTGSTVTEAGKGGINLNSATEVSPTTLTLTEWIKTPNLTTEAQADWYKFTVWTKGTYFLQWDDYYDGTESYGAHIQVSAYRKDGTLLFEKKDGGYTHPQAMQLNAPETVYVKVEPYQNSAGSKGTYAIRSNY